RVVARNAVSGEEFEIEHNRSVLLSTTLFEPIRGEIMIVSRLGLDEEAQVPNR
ncbi:unnamed protein product, partial [Amoebophrya sp. A25]